MKKTYSRMLSTLLILCLLIGSSLLFNPVSSVFQIKVAALDKTGKCGDNASYTFDEKSGLLTISGSGKIYYNAEESPFNNNPNIKKIVIENGITEINDNVFRNCTGLTEVFISKSVHTIINRPFAGSKALLTSIKVDPENRYYDSRNNCNAIIETATNKLILGCSKTVIPYDCVCIGYCSFSGCSSLNNISIPKAVKIIESEAFAGCSGIKEIILPSCIKTIESGAFESCTDLSKVTIPDGIEEIGYAAFYNTALYNDESNWDNGVLYIGNYLIKSKLNSEKYSIKEGTTLIAGQAFTFDSNFKNIQFPEGLKYICDSAFGGCTNLNNVILPDSVLSIGSYAFHDCVSFNKIELPENVKKIDAYAFLNCPNISEISLPKGIEYLGYRAFYDCTNLEKVIIPDSIKTIGNEAFFNTKVYSDENNWENDILYVDNCLIKAREMISGDYKIEKYGIKIIADSAFYDCKNLTSIVIPTGVKSIGSNAFNSWSLSRVVIPETVSYIGRNAFFNCKIIYTFFIGTESEWNKIEVDKADNVFLFRSAIHFNSSDHTLKHNVINSTCTSEGSESDDCIYCDATFNYKSIEKIAHDYGAWTPKVASTCLKTGTEIRYCKNCSEYETRTIPALGHNYKATIVAPTCSSQGYTMYTCTICSYSYKSNYTSKLPHRFDDWTIVKAPTEKANGTGKRICSVCHTAENIELAFKEDENSKVQLMYPYKPNTTIVVKDETQTIGDVIQNGQKTHKLYDITMLKDNQPVQPDGMVNVRIPVPKNFDASRAHVYHLKSRKPLVREEMPSRIEGNDKDGYYIVFKTNHFSYFEITEEVGKVNSVSISNLSLNYKASSTLKPTIKAESNAKYTVKYSSSNAKVATVDKNGKVVATGTGNATITCTVTDSCGNTVKDTCEVTVSYAWWQWIIVIVLFGWIWY